MRFAVFDLQSVSMHTLVFRFCNLSVAEAYRALLHLQNRDLQLPGPCSCFAPSPGSNVSGGHFSFRQFRGRCHYTASVIRFFRLQMLVFGGVFEALSGDVILSGLSGYCFRGF